MSYDLTSMLRDWPYEPGQLAVRLIQGDDGRRKIQIRLDLGVLQLETEGRPDGVRPEGAGSLLEHHEARLDEWLLEGGDAEDFSLDGDECAALREEAVQYYHRYVAFFVLEDFEGVIRDTSRNLRVLDLCANHAESEEDRTMLEQYRPYILTMRARALASLAMRDGEGKAAMLALDQGIAEIREHFQGLGEPEHFESCNEVQLLRGLRQSLAPQLPVSQSSELRDRLRRAVEQENYELAAILRDELRMLSGTGVPPA